MNLKIEGQLDLNKLLEIKEGSNIEIKKSKNQVPKSFGETYSAFANTDGGIVIFGIDEKSKEVTGVTNACKLRDDLFNNLNNPNKVSENIISNKDIKIVKLENGLKILIITIPEMICTILTGLSIKEGTYHFSKSFLLTFNFKMFKTAERFINIRERLE